MPFHKPDAMVPGAEQVTGFAMGDEVVSGKVALTDYNYLTPSTSMAAEKAGALDRDLELYDYPGMYDDSGAGKQVARLRLEEAGAARRQGSGQGTCPRFCAGHWFTLEGHGRDDFNGEKLMLTRVRHRIEKSGQDLEAGALAAACSYENSFDCMPRETPFRPPRIVPRPVVRGPQTAVVVGPSGEEIYTDKHGRVKVQFHWDRLGSGDDKSSCWVRVAQAWAGAGFGAQLIPRVGMEVVVEFLEGDPDRPLVTGCVHHAQNLPPLKLPDQKTRSTLRSRSSPGGDGFNQITLEDRAGKELVYLHAQRDLQEEVLRNQSTDVGQDQTLKVGQDRTVTVDRHEQVTVKGDQKVDVKGAGTVTVGKDLTVTVKGQQTEETGKDLKVTVKGGHTEETTKAYGLKAKTVTLEAADSIEIKCGGASIKLTSSGEIDVTGSGVVKIGGRFIKLN